MSKQLDESRGLSLSKSSTFSLSTEDSNLIMNREHDNTEKCIEVVLILPNGTTLSPQKVEGLEIGAKGQTLFSFDISTTDVKEFKFKILSIRLATGEVLKINFEFDARLLDWTRYLLFSPM